MFRKHLIFVDYYFFTMQGTGRQVATGTDPGQESGRNHPVTGSDQLDGPARHHQNVLRHSTRQGWR
jgi:hypothetical protein